MFGLSYMMRYLQKGTLGSKQGRMHGTFNGMSLFFLVIISFLCYRETAGDSGLPKDSNTVVGKPQLGEQNCNFLWISRRVSLLSRPAQLLFILFLLDKVDMSI